MKKYTLRSTAYLDGPDGTRIVVSIPIDTSGSIPEEPKVVILGDRAYVQTSQSPLTYEYALAGRAKLI